MTIEVTHRCGWPGCKTQVSETEWGCRFHWQTLPSTIRTGLSVAHQTKVERNLTSSMEYLRAAKKAQEWIQANSPSAVLSVQNTA